MNRHNVTCLTIAAFHMIMYIGIYVLHLATDGVLSSVSFQNIDLCEQVAIRAIISCLFLTDSEILLKPSVFTLLGVTACILVIASGMYHGYVPSIYVLPSLCLTISTSVALLKFLLEFILCKIVSKLEPAEHCHFVPTVIVVVMFFLAICVYFGIFYVMNSKHTVYENADWQGNLSNESRNYGFPLQMATDEFVYHYPLATEQVQSYAEVNIAQRPLPQVPYTYV